MTQTYREVVSDAGCVPLADWSTVEVTGRDRASFLHNMCTNDVRSLTPGGGCEAFFTDVKGKIVAHAFILADEEAIQLVMVPHAAQRLIDHLQRYVIREDVQLADRTSAVEWTLVVGFGAAASIAEMTPGASDSARTAAAAWSHEVATLGRGSRLETRIVRCPLPWCGGFLLGCETSQASILHDKLGASRWMDEKLWQALRVESAWPLWGVDFDNGNLPQEVSRDAAAISFRKGCYLGQETVARIDALGHVNKQLLQVKFSGTAVPPVGSELTAAERTVGRVTSSCWSPRFNAPLALAVVQRGAAKPGSAIYCGEQSAEVVVESLAESISHGILPGQDT